MGYTEADSVEGFEAFQEQVKTWEADMDSSKKPLYLLFTGSDGPDGKSWCPDCIVFEKAWEEFKKRYPPKKGTFIRVKVGPMADWKDKECPFRTDKSTKLSSVPTLIKWGSSKRLSGNQIADPEYLSMLLEDD